MLYECKEKINGKECNVIYDNNEYIYSDPIRMNDAMGNDIIVEVVTGIAGERDWTKEVNNE